MMIRYWFTGALAAALLSSSASAQLPAEDRVRLAEARRLATAIQDSVWPAWSTAPFAVLLVTDSLEYLLWHPRPSPDFRAMGYDSLLASDVRARARTLATNLLATFPAVGGVSTVVVGQPAKTGKTSTAWVLTLLHEHFHQLQTSRAGYYAAVDSLQLSGGDQTGMWMLNYPFPYDSLPIQRRFAAVAEALAAAVSDTATAALRRYAAARHDLRASLGDADARYVAFQLWQEGVARYVEYACARRAARGYVPSAAFAALPDYVPYGQVATRLREQILRELRAPDLGANRRVSLYPIGAAMALLLEGRTPRWREQYLARLLTLEPEVDALVGK
jgi:hypothetical protein